MICIECSHEVPNFYTTYSNGYIKLTYCNHCNQVADKYVEFDHVILFIDILLLKPQAYKHLIFNTLLNTNSSNKPGKGRLAQVRHWLRSRSHLIRLTVSFILFEVYLNWAHEELKKDNTRLFLAILQSDTLVQYVFFLIQCTCEFFVAQLVVHFLVYWINGDPILCSKEAVSATVLVAGCTKLYPILMLIWPYDSAISTTMINNYFTNLNFVEALRITIGLKFEQSLMIVLVTLVVKKLLGTLVLILFARAFTNTFTGTSVRELIIEELLHMKLGFDGKYSTVYNLISLVT